LDFKYLNDQGSFKAWSVGFSYEYDAETCILDIIHSRSQRPILYIDSDDSFADDPRGFVQVFDKSIQLNALTYSNNSSIDLSDVLDYDKLPAILNYIARLASYGFVLQNKRFEEFAIDYNKKLGCCGVSITLEKASHYTPASYVTYFKMHDGNAVSRKDYLLHKAIASLSHAIVDDILMTKYLQAPADQAQALLGTASELYILSCIINQDFFPHHYARLKNEKILSKSRIF